MNLKRRVAAASVACGLGLAVVGLGSGAASAALPRLRSAHRVSRAQPRRVSAVGFKGLWIQV